LTVDGRVKKLKIALIFVGSLIRLYARLAKRGFDIIPAQPELILREIYDDMNLINIGQLISIFYKN
jgi:hypothetical protein